MVLSVSCLDGCGAGLRFFLVGHLLVHAAQRPAPCSARERALAALRGCAERLRRLTRMVSACGFLMRCAPIRDQHGRNRHPNVRRIPRSFARQRRLHQQRRRLFRSSSSPLICSSARGKLRPRQKFESLLEIAERVVRGESPPQTVVFQMTEGSPFGLVLPHPWVLLFSSCCRSRC